MVFQKLPIVFQKTRKQNTKPFQNVFIKVVGFINN